MHWRIMQAHILASSPGPIREGSGDEARLDKKNARSPLLWFGKVQSNSNHAH